MPWSFTTLDNAFHRQTGHPRGPAPHDCRPRDFLRYTRPDESQRECAGIYTAHAALSLYAEAFERAGALEHLEGFSSFYGPDFYGLPRNVEQIELVREAWQVPADYDFGGERLTPLCAGETLAWRVLDPRGAPAVSPTSAPAP